MIGTKFTKLTVTEVISLGKMKCVCDCGKEVVVRTYQLKNGNNKSCGCMMQATRDSIGALNKTHGMANSRTKGYGSRAYGIWQAMKDRCSNKNRADQHCYSARGIEVCERWKNSFENFLADMGEPPEGHTLDRKDNDKNYSPDNCRWATRKEQSRNTRSTARVEIDGTTKLLVEWLEELGVARDTYYNRLRDGWTKQEALLGRKVSGIPLDAEVGAAWRYGDSKS